MLRVAALVLLLPDALLLRLDPLYPAPLILVLDDPEVLTLLFTVVLTEPLCEEGVALLEADVFALLEEEEAVVVEELVLLDEVAAVLLCPDAVVLLAVLLWVTARTDLDAELVLVAVVFVTASASRLALRILAFAALVDSTPEADLLFAMISALRSVNECSGWRLP